MHHENQHANTPQCSTRQYQFSHTRLSPKLQFPNCPWQLVKVKSYLDTSASPSTRTRVPRNTSLHVFQWRPFTIIGVLYQYGLPMNFTRMSSFCAGRVFIQPVWSEQHKICTNLIYTVHGTYLMSEIMLLLKGIPPAPTVIERSRVQLVQLLTM